MSKDAATSLAVATTVGAEAPTALKSSAKTPKKPKGWKKWKRRLSQVFKGKKKGKSKLPQSGSTTAGGDPTGSVAQRDLPLRYSKLRRSDGSTDESPDGSEREADRRSADSREWRRKPGSPDDRRSADSRSASEPTDEEWEAEQRRLARQEGGDYDDRSYADEEDEADEELEYDDEEYEEEGPVDAQSDEEQEEFQEDVYEYEEAQEVVVEAHTQVEETEQSPDKHAQHRCDGDESVHEDTATCRVPPVSPLEITVDDETHHVNAEASCDGESDPALFECEAVDHEGESDQGEDGDQEDAHLTDHEELIATVPNDSDQEDTLDVRDQGAEQAGGSAEDEQENVDQAVQDEGDKEEENERDEEEEVAALGEQEGANCVVEDHHTEQEDEENEDDEEDGEDREDEDEVFEDEELEAEELDEEELDQSQEAVELQCAEPACENPGKEADSTVPPASLTVKTEANDVASLLQNIPSHLKKLHDVALWCCDPQTQTTVDTRLLVVCIIGQKWQLAQQLAEKLLRKHKRPSVTSTEAILESILAHCAA